MSITAIRAVMEHSRARPPVKMVLSIIAFHGREENLAVGGILDARPAIATIARMANSQPRQVQRAISALEASGELQVFARAGKPSLYHIPAAPFAPPDGYPRTGAPLSSTPPPEASTPVIHDTPVTGDTPVTHDTPANPGGVIHDRGGVSFLAPGGVIHDTQSRTDQDMIKQQQQDDPVVVVSLDKLLLLITGVGVSEGRARKLIAAHSAEAITRQLKALPYRPNPTNPAGMLIQSIEEEWADPPAADRAASALAKESTRRTKIEEARRAEMVPQYYAHLATLGDVLRAEDPDRWRAVEDSAESQRAAIKGNAILTERAKGSALAAVDSAEWTGERIAEHYAGSDLIPDRDAWLADAVRADDLDF